MIAERPFLPRGSRVRAVSASGRRYSGVVQQLALCVGMPTVFSESATWCVMIAVSGWRDLFGQCHRVWFPIHRVTIVSIARPVRDTLPS
jgi:hypothetical protein